MRYIITLLLAVWFASVSSAQTANLQISDITAECGDMITIPIQVGDKDFGKYNSIQFSLTWDKDALEFQKTFQFYGPMGAPLFLNLNNFGPNSPTFDNDTLTFVWFSGAGVDLEPNTNLFGLNFKVLGGGVPTSAISFINFTPINISAVVNGNPFTNVPNINLNNGLITVTDNVPPVLQCPNDLTILAPPGAGAAIVDNIYPLQASDNCGVAFLGYNFNGATTGNGSGDPSGEVFNEGITTVSYTINDVSNNFNNCSFNILVIDTASVVFTLEAGSKNINCTSQKIAIPVTTENFKDIVSLKFSMKWNASNLELDSIADLNATLNLSSANFGPFNNDTLTFSYSNITGASLPPNDTLFILYFSGVGAASCTDIEFISVPGQDIEAFQSGIPFPVEIQVDTLFGQVCLTDNINPTITCPPDQLIKVASGQFSAVVNNISPNVNDNCGVKSISYILTGATVGNGSGDANGKTFFFGNTNVVYIVEDFAGNTATCNFDVVIQDTVLRLIPTSGLALCDSSKFAINVTVQNFNDIIGLQFGMKWDPSVLQFDTVANFDPNLLLDFDNNFGPIIINDTLTFAWFDFTGLSLPNNTVLFTVYFDLVGQAGSSTLFEFINTPATIIEASNSQGVVAVQAFDALINVFDFQPPVITCPGNQNYSVPQGSSGLNINNIGPVSFSDNCGVKQVNYTLTGSTIGAGINNASGSFFNIGSTVVKYTVEDFGGNQVTCQFTVNVVQDSFTLFTDTLEAQCSNGILAVEVKVKNFTDIASLQFGMSWDPSIIQFDSVGNFNNGLNLLGIFQPNSNFGPAIIDDSLTFAWNNYNGVTLPDGSVIFTLYFSPVSNITTTTFFNFINYPTTPIEVSVKGNPPFVIPYKIINGVIHIDDTEPPVLTCPKDLTVGTDPGLCSAVVNFPNATAIDNCDPLVTISPANPSSGSVFPKGATTITFIGTDDFNNTGTCSFKITVVDDEGPVLVCPQDIVADNDSGECGTTIFLPPLLDVSDNCDLLVTDITVNQDIVKFYPVGKTTVIYTGVDSSGNVGTCTFSITVKDLEPPVLINCPKDTVVQPSINIQNMCFAEVSWIKPTATDNCPNVIVDSDIFPPSLFPPGNTTVHYIAIDASNNTATCQFVVSVQVPNSGFNDCPADITVNATVSTKDSCGANVFWTEPYFIDACGDTLDVYSNFGPGEFFPSGTTKVIYLSAQNSVILDTCMFFVTVVGQIPSFTNCPDSISIPTLDTVCGNYPTWIPPIGFNECGDTVILISNIQPDSFLTLGVHTVIYTAPNFDTCSFTVTIFDNIKPMHGACPPNQMYTVPDTVCGAIVTWTDPTFTDNCDNNLFIVSSDSSGTFFPIGLHVVTYIAIDDYGNVDTCSFEIFIRELQPPVLTACPDDVTLNSLPNACGNFVFWNAPTATDNCDTLISITASSGPGFYTAGVTIVTYTATDDAGNTDTCSFKITILETEPPIITCPGDITVDGNGNVLVDPNDFIIDVAANDCNNLELFFGQIIAVDNCGNVVAIQTSPNIGSGDEFLPGVYDMKFKATDAQGNSDSCSFQITVLPYAFNIFGDTLLCIGDTANLSSPTVPGATAYNWTGPNQFSASGQFILVPITSINSQGTYVLNVVLGDCNNKTYTDSVKINVFPPPDAVNDLDSLGNIDSLIIIMLNNDIANQSINVFLGTTSSGTSILNQNNTISYKPDPNFVGVATIGYTICAVDCPGSCDSATIVLNIKDDSQCLVPNFISPNNDALNDVLFIKCLETDNYPTNRLVIYNEWGDQIYSASPYINNWGGTLETLEGKKVPDGTYFYIFYESTYDQNPRHGYLTILR